MRVLNLLILWIAAISLAGTLYSYGLVQHYRYANDDGQAYEESVYRGDSLDDMRGTKKGYIYRGAVWRLKRNAEGRTILIVLILAGASAASLWIWKREKVSKTTGDT